MFRVANDNALKENYLDMRLWNGFICEQLPQASGVRGEPLTARLASPRLARRLYLGTVTSARSFAAF